MNVYSSGIGDAFVGVPMDNVRRTLDFGNRIAEIAPMESPFFVFLSKVAKRPTPDPVFKFLEQRHQWQRRNFAVETAMSAVNITKGQKLNLNDVLLGCKYDKYGRKTATYNVPLFLLVGQTVQIQGKLDADGAGAGSAENCVVTALVTKLEAPTTTAAKVDLTVRAINGDTNFDDTYNGGTLALAKDAPGQVTGSAFAEGTGAPDGWMDALYSREGYTQIHKTAIPLFSGSSLATVYRGVANEYNRVWAEKLMEHKMDLEHANLFGVGRYEAETGTEPKRFQWGIVPYTEVFGTVEHFSYDESDYDSFLDFMREFHAPENGNSREKLYLTSRKILAWFQKLGSSGFLSNSVGNSLRYNIENVKGSFGHELLKVSTIFGSAYFTEEPLFRGLYEDYCVAVDLRNVAYRPLVGNGISRDTHVITNVQNNDIDGRKDMILTESGLEINLPETHAVLKWS